MKESDRVIVEEIFSKLTGTKRSICESMILAMEYAANARDVIDILANQILSSINDEEIDLKKIYVKLFLISDILFNSSNP